jgi:hypothetical protein
MATRSEATEIVERLILDELRDLLGHDPAAATEDALERVAGEATRRALGRVAGRGRDYLELLADGLARDGYGV